MSTTFDDIRELFRETDRKFQETDRKLQEAALQAEARAEARAAEFTAQLRESARQAEVRAVEVARQAEMRAAELEKSSKLTDEKIREVSKQLGKLGNRLGDWVESMVRPACVKMFRERGIEVHQVAPNTYVERGGEAMEIDLLVVNDGTAVLVECKSQVTPADIADHVERMGKVKRLMPQFANYTIFGAIAGMSMTPPVRLNAERQGFYVIMPNGENVMIANAPEFVAKAW